MDLANAKALSMLALGLGSFVAGMAPACISDRARQRHPLLISCLLCFGGGVLLSTSLVHILPEAREKFPNYSELIFCAGFFLVYFVGELVHFFYGPHSPGHERPRSYVTEESSLLRPNLGRDGEMRERCCGDAGSPRMCHVSHTEPCSKSSSGILGLLCALFVHSFLEGLAIGLQDSASEVLLLLAAVASHKYVVGFCLGAELSAAGGGGGGGSGAGRGVCAHVASVLLFSGGSVAGIGLGAALDVAALADSPAVPIMQALAAGTLLYVAVSEVLPRERARWHERRRAAGVLQFTAVGIGFAVMYLSTMYLHHDTA